MLAFGDSITNGGGELQWGLALQSWALWLARGLGLPFTTYAVDGATAQTVRHEQIPAFRRRAARPDARYDGGCLYIGVNDVRGLDWDAERYGRDLEAVLSFLTDRCARVLALTAPLDLGRPRAGAKVRELNDTIERIARVHGAMLVDLSRFGARNHVMTDHVHPTALGQVAIAERALAVLASGGVEARVRPAEMVRAQPTRWQRLRGDLTYVYRQLKVGGRSLALRTVGGTG